MITAKEISDKYMTMLMHDQDIKEKVAEATEKMYESVVENNSTCVYLKYDIETSKKIAFILRKLGFKIKEFKHGKLHMFLE